MNILYISTVFPKPEDSSTIYTDLAEELHRRGHKLVVVAAEEKCKNANTELRKERGFTVLRVTIGNLYNVGFIEKGFTILRIKSKLKLAVKRNLKEMKFNFILFESPPVTTSGVVKWAMNYFDCPSYLMLKDIFPQNGVDIGLFRKYGLIYYFFKEQELKLYNAASFIGCMSEANKRYIMDHNHWLSKEKIEIFPNTKLIRFINKKVNKTSLRKKYGISENAMVAIFGGNMGKPQGTDFLVDVIKKCKDRKDIFFLLVGRGTERNRINERIKVEDLKNVLMIEALPRDEYEKMVLECDVGLIFLDKRFTIPNFPSRILSYFEYSMPVLAATDTNTDFGKMVEESGAGFWVEAGDIDGFVYKLDILAKDKDLRIKMGNLGRDYLEQNYTVEISARILEEKFSSCSKSI